MIRLTAALLTLALVACGSEPADAPTAQSVSASSTSSSAGVTGFTHTETQSGFYVPSREIRVGPLQLTSLAVAGEEELDAWEAGTRMDTFAPVMLMFDDVTSPMVPTELGEARSVSRRVMPQAYALSPERIAFSGVGEGIGAVAFDGTIDAAALAKAVAAGTNEVVLRGTLTLGEESFADVPFTWTVGE